MPSPGHGRGEQLAPRGRGARQPPGAPTAAGNGRCPRHVHAAPARLCQLTRCLPLLPLPRWPPATAIPGLSPSRARPAGRLAFPHTRAPSDAPPLFLTHFLTLVRQGSVRNIFRMQTRIFSCFLTLLTVLTLLCTTFLVFRFLHVLGLGPSTTTAGATCRRCTMTGRPFDALVLFLTHF